MFALQSFVKRLNAILPLQPEAAEALLSLSGFSTAMQRGRGILEGDFASDHIGFVEEGVAHRFAENRAGARQLTALYIPGDAINLSSLVVEDAIGRYEALTAGAVFWLSRVSVQDIMAEYPSLIRAFWGYCARDALKAVDWIRSLGLQTALERVSYFLFETGERYRAIGQLARGEFPFALTQQQIAAATGLTAVHVNRMLRELRLAGVVDIRKGVAKVLDHDALRERASFADTGLKTT